MTQLIPCPGCNRHVRQAETSCPFCSAALSLADVPEHALPRTRLGRAATFAFGATLVSGFAELLGSVRSAVGRGCPGLADRLRQLPVPDALVRYCASDELRALANGFYDDAASAIADAGCDDDPAYASEALMAACER